MPAIQPARLRQQAVNLANKFNQPDQFIRDLHFLLNHYTDYTHRPGRSTEPSPLQHSYHTPAPVMRQIWQELELMIRRYPEGVLPLSDALWADKNYDLQLLAARLLGQVQVKPPEPVVERLRAWVSQGIEKQLLDKLMEYSLSQLIRTAPDALDKQLSSWLKSPDLLSQQAGLRALLPVIHGAGTERLPIIFHLISPFIRVAPSELRPDILEVLVTLAHRSPSEAAYLLRQSLNMPDNPDTAWLIRQVLHEFPEEIQVGLRMAMKSAGK